MKKVLILILALSFILSSCSKEETGKDNSAVLSSGGIVISKESDDTPDDSSLSESESELNSESESGPLSESETEPQSESSVKSSKNSIPDTNTAEPAGSDRYDTLILVNPWHYIPEDYVLDLENVQGKYNMQKVAAGHAKDLLSAAKAAGYNMQLCSAYRTVEKSRTLYNNKVNQYINLGYSEADAKTEAAKWVAPPGTSEHHTGLAMDLVSSDYWSYYSDLEHDYEKFDSFTWMYEHCAEYGFILRYPKDKQDITGITYEPWHYRYVGKEAAEYIMENGLCLEEYLVIAK